MSSSTLTIIDNRTGQKYELPLQEGTIRALDLRRIKLSPEDFGLMSYDPGFTNTAACRSRITYLDGERGILRHHGYPIEELAEQCSYLEVVYLLWNGELPQPEELRGWAEQVRQQALVPDEVAAQLEHFQRDGYPMSMLASSVAALSSFYPEARDLADAQARRRQMIGLLAKIPTLAALIHRRRQGLPRLYPREDFSYCGDFLRLVFQTTEKEFQPHPVLERALDVLFILHADHEQNCSTSAMRNVGSSRADLFLSAAAAIGALAGPLHGGANEAVLRMLQRIGSKDQVPAYVRRVKEGEFRLMGFGHRVYKNYDPRARIIKRLADQVFEVTGINPLLEVALELERIALQDEYFVSRKLYPNVDFYSGLIYQAMGFPPEMFTVLFAVARTAGWLAQWEEMIQDPEQRIARPRQIYQGLPLRQVAKTWEASGER